MKSGNPRLMFWRNKPFGGHRAAAILQVSTEHEFEIIIRWCGRAAMILAIVGVLSLPLSARAESTYFCNASVSQGGNGSATSPWACADDAQLEAVLNTVCTNGGGTLYRSLGDSFVTYTIRPTENGGCAVDSQTSPGQPPTAGGDSWLSPLLLGAALLGMTALGVGLLLRLRTTRP